MKHLHNNNTGFTLVEVIVVAVIVAVLAAVAIPLYIGYVNDSTVNVCSNIGTDLATAVSSAINTGATGIAGWGGTIIGPVAITWTMPASFMDAGGVGTNTVPTFRVPNGITITTTGTGFSGTGTIQAAKTGKPLLKGAMANY